MNFEDSEQYYKCDSLNSIIYSTINGRDDLYPWEKSIYLTNYVESLMNLDSLDKALNIIRDHNHLIKNTTGKNSSEYVEGIILEAHILSYQNEEENSLQLLLNNEPHFMKVYKNDIFNKYIYFRDLAHSYFLNRLFQNANDYFNKALNYLSILEINNSLLSSFDDPNEFIISEKIEINQYKALGYSKLNLPSSSKKINQENLILAESHYGKYSDTYSTLLLNYAKNQLDNDNPSRAIELNLENISINDSLLTPQKEYIYNNLAMCYDYLEDSKTAIFYLKKALNHLSDSSSNIVLTILDNLSMAYYNIDSIDSAYYYSNQAIDHEDKYLEYSNDNFILYNNRLLILDSYDPKGEYKDLRKKIKKMSRSNDDISYYYEIINEDFWDAVYANNNKATKLLIEYENDNNPFIQNKFTFEYIDYLDMKAEIANVNGNSLMVDSIYQEELKIIDNLTGIQIYYLPENQKYNYIKSVYDKQHEILSYLLQANSNSLINKKLTHYFLNNKNSILNTHIEIEVLTSSLDNKKIGKLKQEIAFLKKEINSLYQQTKSNVSSITKRKYWSKKKKLY